MSLFGVRRPYRFFLVLSLGSEENVDNQSVPLQHSEQLQQGKQFDHVNPIIFKSNMLFTTCMYALLFCCQIMIGLVDPLVA